MNAIGPTSGLWMLLALGLLIVATGLPVWALLIGTASLFAVLGLAAGVIDLNVLAVLPARMVVAGDELDTAQAAFNKAVHPSSTVKFVSR